MTAMEWVETTGRTVEDAKAAALDQLGVHDLDAEFEVVEAPRAGLFGRLRGEARVRARVRPVAPRPKVDRRDRRKAGKGRDGRARAGAAKDDTGKGREGRPKAGTAKGAPSGGRGSRGARSRDAHPDAEAGSTGGRADEPVRATADRPGATPDAAPSPPPARRRRRAASTSTTPAADRSDQTMTETELAAQGEVVKDFLVELLDAFEADGTVTVTVPDDENVDIAVEGGDLGLLIGPKGQTLQAIQELSRSVLQRTLPGQTHGRIRVDVSGYRQRRKEALERFTREVAEQVVASGTETALEPMSPPDRKIVHDTVNEIAGVSTTSEGEEPRRRVVIRPE